jgi:hypothetical protein
VHLVHEGLVDDRVRIPRDGRDRVAQLVDLARGGGSRLQHRPAHVVHQLREEDLVLLRAHPVGDGPRPHRLEPGGLDHDRQARADRRLPGAALIV